MRRPCALLALAFVCAAFPSAADAEPLVAIDFNRQLLFFDSASPTSVTTKAITGLGASDRLRGLDVRPDTGELLAISVVADQVFSSPVKTWSVNPDTGAAVLRGQTATAPAGAGDQATGFDFNPVTGKTRLVNSSDEHIRLSADNGAFVADDPTLSPAASTILVGLAHDRNRAGASATTVYGIDKQDSTLVRLGGIDGDPSPNLSEVTEIGPLGVPLVAANAADAGFDIAASGVAYASLIDVSSGLTRLYTVNLRTGTAAPLGNIGTGNQPLAGLAAMAPEPAPLPTGPEGPAGPEGLSGIAGCQGTQGPAGAPGAQGPAGLAGDDTTTSTLDAVLGLDRYAGRRGRRLTVRFATSLDCIATLEIRKGSKTVMKVSDVVEAGPSSLRFKKLPSRGRYTLHLDAQNAGGQTADSAKLRVRR